MSETASMLRVSRETVRRMVHAGKLGAIVLGSGNQTTIRIPRDLIVQLVADATAGQTVVPAQRSIRAA